MGGRAYNILVSVNECNAHLLSFEVIVSDWTEHNVLRLSGRLFAALLLSPVAPWRHAFTTISLLAVYPSSRNPSMTYMFFQSLFPVLVSICFWVFHFLSSLRNSMTRPDMLRFPTVCSVCKPINSIFYAEVFVISVADPLLLFHLNTSDPFEVLLFLTRHQSA
jgi:hypothetical protein